MKGDFRSSISPTPTTQVWFLSEPSLGPKCLGTSQHAINPQSSTEHMFVGVGGGTISKLVNGDSEPFKRCQEQSEGSGEQ